jgi:LytR cell envelope-related transcriptional attenuator
MAVTILGGGDLAPRRRGGSIGRWVVTVLVLVLLAGGGFAAYLGLTGSSSDPDPVATAPHCVAPVVAGPSRPHQVHVVVLNGTLRNGLAGRVAASLKHRGFHVAQIGNTPRLVTGVAIVRYGSGQLLDAQAVADQIQGATVVRATLRDGAHVSTVQLDVGPQFNSLRTAAAATLARAQIVAAKVQAIAASASPSPSPSC